jgi:hypothetical protein
MPVRRSTVLLASTIGFAALYIVAAVVLGTTPDANDDGPAVLRWFQRNGGHVRAWLWLLTLALPLFATFAALVRSRLPSPHRDVFFFGAIALAAETAVWGWVWAGLSWHTAQLQPATARTLVDVASYYGPVLTGATITMFVAVAIVALGRRAGLPRWLGVLAAVVAIEQLVETITIFGHHGFIAPGGAMNFDLGAPLTIVAFVCLGITAARSMSTEASIDVEGGTNVGAE